MALELVELGMPFLNDEIVDAANSMCPHMSEYNMILQNMIYLHMTHDISLKLTEECVNTIMEYFSMYSMHRAFVKHMVKLAELPLFKDITGNYTELMGKRVYLCNSDVSSIPKIIDCLNLTEDYVVMCDDWKWADFFQRIHPQASRLSPEEACAVFVIPGLITFSEAER